MARTCHATPCPRALALKRTRETGNGVRLVDDSTPREVSSLTANHVRPLLAFCVLALTAAVIAALGLQGRPRDSVAAPPASTPGPREVVTSGRPTQAPVPAATTPTGENAWIALIQAGKVTPAVPAVASGVSPTAATSASSATVRTTTRATTRATTPRTSSPAPAPKPRRRHVPTTAPTPTTATRTTSTAPRHGHGKAKGRGQA